MKSQDLLSWSGEQQQHYPIKDLQNKQSMLNDEFDLHSQQKHQSQQQANETKLLSRLAYWENFLQQCVKLANHNLQIYIVYDTFIHINRHFLQNKCQSDKFHILTTEPISKQCQQENPQIFQQANLTNLCPCKQNLKYALQFFQELQEICLNKKKRLKGGDGVETNSKNNQQILGKCLNFVGLIYLCLGFYQDATLYLQRAQKKYKMLYGKNNLLYLQVMYNIGICQYLKKQLTKSCLTFQKCQEIMGIFCSNSQILQSVIYNIAIINFLQANYMKCKLYLNMLIKIIKQTNNSIMTEQQVMLKLGYASFLNGQYSQCIQILQKYKSKTIANIQKMEHRVVNLYMQLANTIACALISCSKQKQALSILKSCQQMIDKINKQQLTNEVSLIHSIILANIGYALYKNRQKQNKLDIIVQYLARSLKIQNQILQSQSNISIAVGNIQAYYCKTINLIGTVYMLKSNYNFANQCFHRNLRFLRGHHLKKHIQNAKTLLNIGCCNKNQGKKQIANEFFIACQQACNIKEEELKNNLSHISYIQLHKILQMYIIMAQAQLQLSQPERSIYYYLRAQTVLKIIHHNLEITSTVQQKKMQQKEQIDYIQIKIQFKLAQIYQMTGTRNSSINCFQQCQRIINNINQIQTNTNNNKNIKQYAQILNNFISLCLDLGEIDKAMQYMEKVQILNKKQGKGQVQNSFIHKMETKKNNLQQLQLIMQYHLKNYQTMKLNYGQYSLQCVKIQIKIANIYLKLKKYSQSLELFLQCSAKQMVLHHKNSMLKIPTLKKIAEIYQTINMLEQSLMYFSQCKQIFQLNQPINDVSLYCQILTKVGNLTLKTSSAQKALPFLSAAQQLYFKYVGNQCLIATQQNLQIVTSLARVHKCIWQADKTGNQKKHRKTQLTWLLKGESICDTLKDDQSFKYGQLSLQLGECYQYFNYHHQALVYYYRRQKIISKHYGQNCPQYATIMNKLGGIYIKIGQIDRSVDSYTKCLTISQNAYNAQIPEKVLPQVYSNLDSSLMVLISIHEAMQNNQQRVQLIKILNKIRKDRSLWVNMDNQLAAVSFYDFQ